MKMIMNHQVQKQLTRHERMTSTITITIMMIYFKSTKSNKKSGSLLPSSQSSNARNVTSEVLFYCKSQVEITDAEIQTPKILQESLRF